MLRIPQSSSITGTSPSDYLVSYVGHSLVVVSYPYADVQSVYSTSKTDWVSTLRVNVNIIIINMRERHLKRFCDTVLSCFLAVFKITSWACPHGVMVKAMDCGILVSEYELQSYYYSQFQTNTLILPVLGYIVTLLLLHSHNHIHIQLYTYTCGSKINNNDERTQFFRKIYLSHFIRNGCERVAKGLCVRGELETEQTATYWPPVPLSFAALLSRFTGLLNQEPWGPIALW